MSVSLSKSSKGKDYPKKRCSAKRTRHPNYSAKFLVTKPEFEYWIVIGPSLPAQNNIHFWGLDSFMYFLEIMYFILKV